MSERQPISISDYAPVVQQGVEYVVLPENAPERTNFLSNREVEVLLKVAEGLTSRKISEQLIISERTVEHHIAKIGAKLNVQKKKELATIFWRTTNILSIKNPNFSFEEFQNELIETARQKENRKSSQEAYLRIKNMIANEPKAPIASNESRQLQMFIYEMLKQRMSLEAVAEALNKSVSHVYKIIQGTKERPSLVMKFALENSQLGEERKSAILTAQEKRIVSLSAWGYKATEIATTLLTTPASVRHQYKNILKKLGVNYMAEAVIRAIMDGYISAQEIGSALASKQV